MSVSVTELVFYCGAAPATIEHRSLPRANPGRGNSASSTEVGLTCSGIRSTHHWAMQGRLRVSMLTSSGRRVAVERQDDPILLTLDAAAAALLGDHGTSQL